MVSCVLEGILVFSGGAKLVIVAPAGALEVTVKLVSLAVLALGLVIV